MIAKAVKSATEFLKGELKKEVTLLKAAKVEGGWEVRFEVVEKDKYVAAIVPRSTTYARNTYVVKLDSKFDIISYENLGQKYTHPQSEVEKSE